MNQSWLAGAPAIGLSQRESRTGNPAVGRESGFEIALPLWRSGQRLAGLQSSEALSGWASWVEQAERLRLAGRLREKIGDIQLAQVELNQLQRQSEVLSQLEQDVQRRVQAGDLARVDWLTARSEWLAVQTQAEAANQALSVAQGQWRLLTGLAPALPQATGAPASTQLPDTHPELLAAHAAIELAQRRVASARLQRSDSPEVSFGVRQERPGSGSSQQNSVVMAFRIPVGAPMDQPSRIAAALSELEITQAQARMTRERLNTELSIALNQLSISSAQLQIEQERSAVLNERVRLLDKSFRAGETALPDMLRTLAAAASADGAHERQKIHHQLAITRLEQALGILP